VYIRIYTVIFDFECHFLFPVVISTPEQWSGNSFYCLGHSKNVYDDDDDDLKTIDEFQRKNYKVSRNFAENYKSRQNMAHPNISHILGSAGFIFKNSARMSTVSGPVTCTQKANTMLCNSTGNNTTTTNGCTSRKHRTGKLNIQQ